MITLEVFKMAYTAFIEGDATMIGENFQDKSPQPCRAQSISLHEELGCINYILSDKTGTITQNHLLFRAMIIDGILLEGEPSHLGTLA